MSVHEAQPGDIYVDEHDKLWRVTGRWDEPVVSVEAVEPDLTGIGGSPNKTKQQGGLSGLMWKGFRFLHRPKPKHQSGGVDWLKSYQLSGDQRHFLPTDGNDS